MKLASYNKTHYELGICEDIHNEYPDSYWIPERELRDNLKCGDTSDVKESLKTIEVRFILRLRKNMASLFRFLQKCILVYTAANMARASRLNRTRISGSAFPSLI